MVRHIIKHLVYIQDVKNIKIPYFGKYIFSKKIFHVKVVRFSALHQAILLWSWIGDLVKVTSLLIFQKFLLSLHSILIVYLDSFSKHYNKAFFIQYFSSYQACNNFLILCKLQNTVNIHFLLILSQYFYAHNNERNQLA